MKQKINLKAVVLLLTVGLLLGATVGGTLAWLATKTKPVENTFTAGNINITLTENVDNTKSFKLVPGTTIKKDPTVAVLANSEACWLFVKVDESNTTDYLTYEPADGWKIVPGQTNLKVYYREVNADDAKAGKSYSVLKGDVVTVPNTVAKQDLDKIGMGEGKVTPKLTFTAYAVQREGIDDVGTAWTQAQTAQEAAD